MEKVDPSNLNVIDIKHFSGAPTKKSGNVFQLHAKPKPKNKKWSKAKCIESAAKYDNKTAWSKGESGAAQFARDNGFYDECTAHMPTRSSKWTKEKCLKSAAKFDTRKKWVKGERGAYNYAKQNGFFDECVAHMQTKSIKWSKELCLKSAARYTTKGDWFKADNGAYKYAMRNDIFNECVAHMPVRRKRAVNILKWTKEKCFKSAAKYDTRSKWGKAASGAVAFAKKNGIYEECVAHMVSTKTNTANNCSEAENKPTDIQDKFKLSKGRNTTLVLGLYVENKKSA
jgi:hypothetical protein